MSSRLTPEFRDRTKRYAAATIRLYVKLPKNREEVRVTGKQLLRSGTSVAAHVREASRARSDNEFVSKLGGALQEADESILWLELLREECGIDGELTIPLEKGASGICGGFSIDECSWRRESLSRALSRALSEVEGGRPAQPPASFLRWIIQGGNYFVNIVVTYFDPNYCVYFVVNCFETGIVHEQSSRCSYPR